MQNPGHDSINILINCCMENNIDPKNFLASSLLLLAAELQLRGADFDDFNNQIHIALAEIEKGWDKIQAEIMKTGD